MVRVALSLLKGTKPGRVLYYCDDKEYPIMVGRTNTWLLPGEAYEVVAEPEPGKFLLQSLENPEKAFTISIVNLERFNFSLFLPIELALLATKRILQCPTK